MAQVQITDVVVPAEFTAYQVENSLVSTALCNRVQASLFPTVRWTRSYMLVRGIVHRAV